MEPTPQRSRASQEMARLIEHTLRRADVTLAELERHCAEALTHQFSGVMIGGAHVARAAHLLEDTETRVACCVGFPFGTADADAKRYEAELAVDHGAQDLEVAANLGRLKDGDSLYLLRELRDLVEAADERPVSLYLDTHLLSPDQIRLASALAVEAGLQGLTVAGETEPAALNNVLQQVRKLVGDQFRVKVHCDSCNLPEILAMLKSGATRFGHTKSLSLMAALDASPPRDLLPEV